MAYDKKLLAAARSSWNASARLTPRSWKRAGVIFIHASRVSAQSTAS
ncbi:MAG: hypothetical protein ACLUDF_03120 [Butyricicoccus sp.]